MVIEKCFRICRWSVDLGASVFWNPGLGFVFSRAVGNTSFADSLKTRVNISKLGLTTLCMWQSSGWVSAVFLEGIGWDPENAVGDTLEYAQNLAGETSGMAMLTHTAGSVCMPVTRHLVGTHLGCSFTWLPLWSKPMGIAVAQSQGDLD